jgi:peptidoglycan hydrolase CwlO-like protein
MIPDTHGRQLHDRATRGEALSVEERTQLEEWYAHHDRDEAHDLGLEKTQRRASDLQAQIDAALAQLTTLTKRIQEIAAENDALRQEIAALRRQVPQLV